MSINGVDVNPEEFFNLLNKYIKHMDRRAEREITKFKSKNSKNALYYKTKEKIVKIYNELQNLTHLLDEIS